MASDPWSLLWGFFLSEFGFIIGVLILLSLGSLVVEVVLVVQDYRRRPPRFRQARRGGRR